MKEKSKDKSQKRPKDIEMNLDEFGVLNTSVSIERLNDFLDDNLEDKKLKDRKKKKS